METKKMKAERCKDCNCKIESGKTAKDSQGNTYCYACMSKADHKVTLETGKGYLYDHDNELIDWPGIIRIKPIATSEGKHNIAGKRYNFWFRFLEEKYVWYGVRYGNYTEIVHIKRTKQTKI